MKKFISTFLSSAALTAILVMSQYQTKAGTLNASSVSVADEQMDLAVAVAAPQYSYWLLVNSGYALITVQQ
jgi:hypothetical protein